MSLFEKLVLRGLVLIFIRVVPYSRDAAPAELDWVFQVKEAIK